METQKQQSVKKLEVNMKLCVHKYVDKHHGNISNVKINRTHCSNNYRVAMLCKLYLQNVNETFEINKKF